MSRRMHATRTHRLHGLSHRRPAVARGLMGPTLPLPRRRRRSDTSLARPVPVVNANPVRVTNKCEVSGWDIHRRAIQRRSTYRRRSLPKCSAFIDFRRELGPQSSLYIEVASQVLLLSTVRLLVVDGKGRVCPSCCDFDTLRVQSAYVTVHGLS
jgi:hypothetical protein